MGQKIHPKLFRLKNIYNWSSLWFDTKNYSKYLKEDIEIRSFIKNAVKEGAITDVEIKRTGSGIDIDVYTARPGIVIGRSGAGVEELKKKMMIKFFPDELNKKLNKYDININIKEISKPNLSAEFVRQLVVVDIEKRIPFKRAIRQGLDKIEKAGAIGAKIMVSGRLNGVEIARREFVSFGKLPLHTLRADIDYAQGIARTTYGAIGVKIWIYKGEVFNKKLT